MILVHVMKFNYYRQWRIVHIHLIKWIRHSARAVYKFFTLSVVINSPRYQLLSILHVINCYHFFTLSIVIDSSRRGEDVKLWVGIIYTNFEKKSKDSAKKNMFHHLYVSSLVCFITCMFHHLYVSSLVFHHLYVSSLVCFITCMFHHLYVSTLFITSL